MKQVKLARLGKHVSALVVSIFLVANSFAGEISGKAPDFSLQGARW